MDIAPRLSPMAALPEADMADRFTDVSCQGEVEMKRGGSGLSLVTQSGHANRIDQGP
jgi:hypothetical protein